MNDPVVETVGCSCGLLSLLVTVALVTAVVAIVWRLIA